MSQQEFQFEEQQEQTIDQLKQNKKRGDQPKSDHPSLFADSIPPYTYHAQHQEYAEATEKPYEEEPQQISGHEEHSYYKGYQSDRPQQQSAPPRQQGVPAWARPQPHNGPFNHPKWAVWLIGGILAIIVVPILLKVVGIIVLALLSIGLILFLIILIPLLILGVLFGIPILAMILGFLHLARPRVYQPRSWYYGRFRRRRW